MFSQSYGDPRGSSVGRVVRIKRLALFCRSQGGVRARRMSGSPASSSNEKIETEVFEQVDLNVPSLEDYARKHDEKHEQAKIRA